jgi:acyl-phosphate glycerol 3-phosphate acyltransferase
MNLLPLALTLLVSYLVGAVPFGYLVARARGVDILRQGSGNIGATNVGRVLGRGYGLLVFLLDFAKGALPVLAAGQVPPDPSWPPDLVPVAAGVAAFLGHLFPVYLRFRGGKGVATGAGAVAVLMPGPVLGALLAWTVVFVVSRYVSLASLTAAAVLCGLRLACTDRPWGWDHRLVTLFGLVAATLVLARHHANIRRLLRGTENRFQDTPAMLLFAKTLHVLALGLWFGTVVFFTVAGVVIFQAFEQVSALPRDARPPWLPLPAAFDREPFSDRFPDPLRKEQGSRAAGTAVGPLFPWYFGIQAVCALVTVITARAWWSARPGEKVHRVRTLVLLLALLGVVVGWALEEEVSRLRGPRNDTTDAVLLSPAPGAELIARADAARAAFGRWHACSLLANFATLLLVTVAMALAAQLPGPSGVGDDRKVPLPGAGQGLPAAAPDAPGAQAARR